jgi:hypothetical protein
METINLMDPRHRRRQNISLFVGYALVGCVIMLLSIILLFIAFGFGYKNGQVIQSGLLFISSLPRPAQIYIDGKRYKDTTNTRLILQAGTYNFSLARNGYRDWRRSIDVIGGQVESYTYPFLFPSSLTTNTWQDYVGRPALTTQSPDQRWLLVSRPASFTALDEYDLNSPKKAPVPLALPASLYEAGSVQSLLPVAWAGDNTHLLLKHIYDGKTEYVLINRTAPELSVNITKTLALSQTGTDLRLDSGQFDRYLVLDTVTERLSRARLTVPGLQPYINNVLTYDAAGDNLVLYATPDTSDTSKVLIDLYDGNHTYTLRQVRAGSTYLLALASYQGDNYAAVSASNENVAFIYRNPISQIVNRQLGVAVPVRVLNIKAPNSVSFSAGGQYVVFENGSAFAVYDVDNQQRYSYTVPSGLDSPQTRATWMDGARLQYVSQGQLVVFDYDGQNRETIVSADPAYIPSYDSSYKTLYALVSAAADKSHELLTSTPLRTPADQ